MNLSQTNPGSSCVKKCSIFNTLSPFRILSLSEPQTVEEDQVATFTCAADGHPFDEDTIKWDLPHQKLIRWNNRKDVSVDLEKKVSTLKIHFANRHDAGRVVCSVGNGVRYESIR